jgi:hypothetical protein
MNEELNLDVTVVVVFYSNFNFLKATVRGERHPKSKSGDKIKISKPCPCPPLALLISNFNNRLGTVIPF